MSLTGLTVQSCTSYITVSTCLSGKPCNSWALNESASAARLSWNPKSFLGDDYFKIFVWPSCFYMYTVLACIWNQPEIISQTMNYKTGTVCSFCMAVLSSWCSSLTYVLWHLHKHQRTLLLSRPMPAVPPRAKHCQDLLPGDCKAIVGTKVSTVPLPHNGSSWKMLSVMRKPFLWDRLTFGNLSFAVFIEKLISTSSYWEGEEEVLCPYGFLFLFFLVSSLTISSTQNIFSS